MTDVAAGNFLLGVSLALLGVVAYALGAVNQLKLASIGRRTKRGYALALGFNLAGGVLHVFALRFGSLSVVQPIGALTLVVALPTAAMILHRRISRLEWWGAAITIVGVAGMVSLIRPAAGGHIGLDGHQLWTMVWPTGVAVAILLWVGLRHRRPMVGSLSLSVLTGLVFAIASVVTQTLALTFTDHGFSAFTEPLFLLEAAMVGALALCGIVAAQASYRAGLGAQLGTSTLVNAAFSALTGLTLLGETHIGGSIGVIGLLAAAAVAVAGVVLLASNETDSTTGPVPLADTESPNSGGESENAAAQSRA